MTNMICLTGLYHKKTVIIDVKDISVIDSLDNGSIILLKSKPNIKLNVLENPIDIYKMLKHYE